MKNVHNITIQQWDDKVYNKVRKVYLASAYQEQEKWENYMYNAVLRAVKDAEPKHLQDVLFVSRENGRYRSACRVLKAMHLPWAWGDITSYTQTPRSNTKRLAALRSDGTYGWEKLFLDTMMFEADHQQTEPKWDWESKKAQIIRLVKQAKEHGIMLEQIEEEIKKVA